MKKITEITISLLDHGAVAKFGGNTPTVSVAYSSLDEMIRGLRESLGMGKDEPEQPGMEKYFRAASHTIDRTQRAKHTPWPVEGE